MKEIKFTYSGKEYVLTYTRESVVEAERMGMNMSGMEGKPIGTMLDIFRYSFLAHHKAVSEKTINEIYKLFDDKTGLIEKLADMYRETVETLMSDDKSKNAIKWEANF